MSSGETLIIALGYVPLLALVYAAYWAFGIRNALTMRLYRNQALALGLFSLVLMIAALPSPQPGESGILGSVPFEIGYLLVTAAFWLGVVFFVDSTMLAVRRSDPLLRDTLYWSKVRYVLYVVQISIVLFIILGVLYSTITGNPTLADQILAGNNGATTSIPADIADLAWTVSFASCVMFVPAAIRTKDPTLRSHFKWLCGIAILVLVYFVSTGALESTPLAGIMESTVGESLETGFFFLLVGYFLYRSAKALVPLNRIPSSPTH